MKYGTALGALVLGLLVAVFLGGCWPGLAVGTARLEAMRAEIEALVADRSSTSDSECGIAYIGACGGDYVVYSRTTVDENVLLEKVRQYNDLDEFLGRQFHLLCLAYEPIPLEARSENGVCVAVTPGAESGS